MSTRECPSCGGKYRKGKRVLRITASGSSRQTVCSSCAALAVPVLATDGASMCKCGKRHAVYCPPCAATLGRLS